MSEWIAINNFMLVDVVYPTKQPIWISELLFYSHCIFTQILTNVWYDRHVNWIKRLPRSWFLKLWSAITRDRIAQDSQLWHRRIRQTATHPLRYVVRTCDIIVRCFKENPFFTLPKKFMAFIQKAVERKLNTLEIKFLHKNVSYDRNFAKVL